MSVFLIDFLKLIASFVSMIVAADILIKGAVILSEKFNLPKAFVGAVFVGLGTSAPELFASLMSAYLGEGVLAAGNVMGSNIFNSTLVMGACLFFPFHLSKAEKSVTNLIWVLLPAAMLWVFIRDGAFSIVEGVLFLTPLPFFLYSMITSGVVEEPDAEILEESKESIKIVLKAVAFIVFGALFLAVGANLGIQGSLGLVDYFGIPKAFAGAIIIAAGTGLPELVTTVVAGLKKETDLAFANIMGSNALNIFLVLGLSSSLFPFKVSQEMATRDSFYLFGVALMLLPVLVLSKRSLQLAWGGALLMAYCTFFYLQL